jgi:hypothetical protein
MTDLLHHLGYPYKKPKVVPCLSNDDDQKAFLEYYLGYLHNKPANEAVFFIDAVHPIPHSMPAYGWFRKGKARRLKSNTGRTRLNLHGAMNAETFETTMIASEEHIDKSSTIQ